MLLRIYMRVLQNWPTWTSKWPRLHLEVTTPVGGGSVYTQDSVLVLYTESRDILTTVQ